jgi:hypothetical protein
MAREDWYAQIRKDQISWWVDIVDGETGRAIRNDPCEWRWSAKWWAPRLLARAIRIDKSKENTIVVHSLSGKEREYPR